MRLDLTEEQELVRVSARRFLESKAPVSTVRAQFDSPDGFTRSLWRQMSELGWTCLGLPEGAGGFPVTGNAGQDLAIVAEEIGRMLGAGPFVPTTVVLDALAQSDADRSHEALLRQVTEGGALVAWAFAEPGNRWNPDTFDTIIRPEGDEFVLEGGKAYVEAGAQADFLLVTACAGLGLAQVVLPVSELGVHISPCRSVDFVRRFAEVHFDRVRAPRSALVGEYGAAEAQVERQVQLALLLQCAETNGALERAFEFTVDYMRERYAFGRPVASYQALKHRLADMLLKVQSCMATTDVALEAFDTGSPDACRLSRIAKAYVGANATALVSDLVQMTGGIAVTWDHDLHLYERRIAVNRAMFGTPERHREEVRRLITSTVQQTRSV